MKKIISFFLGSILALNLSITAANSAANEVRVAFFLEWATPNQEDKVKKTFDKALGVPVKWTNFATGGEMTEAMLSGDIDISYSQGLTPFVNAVNAKAAIKLVDIAVIYGMGGTTCVAAKGIDKGNASSKLDGQKVAVPLGTMADYVFKETMRVVGADISKMKVVDMNPEDGSAAFVNGDVAMACLFGGKSIKAAKEKGASLLTVKEAQDAGIAGIDITSVTNKFLKENPGMVRTFVEVTHEANARYNSGKSDMSVIAKDAAMDLAGTKKQMGGFEFINASKMKSNYMNKGGILMTYLEVMGNMFATSENPALKDYSKVVDTSYLP
ncbi:MAG: taurine ABC transporter substrate-binding protein [Candidatus Pelagibacter sp.]|nr:taurine ABC transporter substrate-binding protein [Candidatus Pelagibacter sp.]|tara:strand:+ start:270 stop:1247 length:978 start_codon:yes stop_codon:yes gene_type:complete